MEEKRKIKAQAFHERKVRRRIESTVGRAILTASQLTAIKLRQKAVADNAASFETLVALGY